MSTIMLSIVIPVHNCLELTKICLKSLAASLEGFVEYEVIIVDDVSTDGTREFLATLEAPHHVILNKKKGNYAINNNRAVAIARGEYLCLLNNDIEMQKGWLEPMLSIFDKCPDAGFVGNVQIIPTTGRYDHFGICFSEWLIPQHYGQHFRRIPSGIKGTASRWGAVTGACVIIKKSVFDSFGGFDEAYINGCEDIDLCLRLHNAGYWHYVAHRSVIWHYKGSSPGRKVMNQTNLERLNTVHGHYIRKQLITRDAHLAAQTYLMSAIAAPGKINASKLLRAIRCSFRKIEPPMIRQPECFDL